MTDAQPPTDPNTVWVADEAHFPTLAVELGNAADAVAQAKRRFVTSEAGTGDNLGDSGATGGYYHVYVKACCLLDSIRDTLQALSDRMLQTGFAYTGTDDSVARTMGPR